MTGTNLPQPVWVCGECGNSYGPEEACFLYSDELGSRCGGCGSLLLVSVGQAVMPEEEKAALLTVSGERIQPGG